MIELNLQGLYGIAKGNNVKLYIGRDNIYRPFPGNDIKLNLDGVYSPPAGNEVVLRFGGVELPTTGYIPTSDLMLINQPYIPTADLEIGVPPPPPPVNITLVSYGNKLGWGVARPVDTGTNCTYGRTDKVDTIVGISYGQSAPLNTTILVRQQVQFISIDNGYKLPASPFANHADSHYKLTNQRLLAPTDLHTKLSLERRFIQADTGYSNQWGQGTPADVDYTFRHNAVRLNGVERVPIFEGVISGYIPSGDIELKAIPYIPSADLAVQNIQSGDTKFIPYEKPNGDEVILSFNEQYETPLGNNIRFIFGVEDTSTADRVLVGFERTPLQPTGSPFKAGFGKASVQIDKSQTFAWGYGLNNFVIGGVTTIPSRPDPVIPPEPDPPIVHINYEVYRVVNTVNITVRPSGQFLDFDNFSITRDVESFAWTCTFDLLTLESYNLVRPVGRALQTIDININGTIFTVFVGKANTSVRSTANGTTRVYRCTAWSNLKRLSYPYARRRSFSDSQARTAAQIATNELTGTGFTVDWQTVDWQVPVGVHTYQNKTSLGAVLGVVNAIGGVIVPDLSENAFTVRPYYPVSPWNWDDPLTQINREMNESQFFSIDNDTIPRDNPNGVYVYGQEQGVGVFAVRLGTPGNELLPDVVDRYITANTAGQERGRIEVARNSFIELIPMTTYVDENGIIMPQELIEFTALDDTTWRGMVVQTTVNCSRVGTALTQQITIARFFDG
tara:strand:+ start:2862 stop:5051 length:2190 start_codon:yes stop_codon:yes gene_type:complete